MARTRLYRDGELVREDFPVSEISDHIAEPNAFVWLDYCEPTSEDLATIAQELQLHPLAVEDAVNEHQRPKLDRYDTHLFVNAYTLALDTGSGRAGAQARSACSSRAMRSSRCARTRASTSTRSSTRWDESKELAEHGVSFLLWGVLDFIVDGHFEAVQSLDTEIEALEDLLFDDRPREAEVQRRSFELRKSLVLLRRLVTPMREVVNSLMRRDLHVLDQQWRPTTKTSMTTCCARPTGRNRLRDLVTTILETNIAIQGNRMNLVMKKVTSWAAIIAVPTAITGFYGQNVPYPGFAAHWGFWFSTVVDHPDVRLSVLGFSP